MTRGLLLAVVAVPVVVGCVVVALLATAEPEPRPAPSRVYSSCLAADTQPLEAGKDPCAGP
ncbi:hypothetical protein ABZY90_25745 [Streptomyces sp. NPDC006422]|uniref:hypothetical protein n=1 Tax=unclassified Streptomyces TaxID=2593676 RepID=UPI0033BD6EB0